MQISPLTYKVIASDDWFQRETKFQYYTGPNIGPLTSLFSYSWWYEYSECGEPRRNYIDSEKRNNLEKRLFQYNFVHYKHSMDWPGRQPGPPRWETDE
jgi:hypothetical protein